MKKFKPNDPIYYYHKNGDTYPGTVFRQSEKRVYIRYNGLERDVIAWVSPESLTLQEDTIND